MFMYDADAVRTTMSKEVRRWPLAHELEVVIRLFGEIQLDGSVSSLVL